MNENPYSGNPIIKRGPEAQIALCKCKERRGKTYGVRFQRDGEGWKYTWAFAIDEDSARREGYGDTEIVGDIHADKNYPGCPYCGTRYFVVCGDCKHLNCNVGASCQFTCEWCGMTGEIGAFDGDGIASGGDRA